MNDISQKRGLLRGPIVATLLFVLVYGAVMLLVIAPRSFLTGPQVLAEDYGVISDIADTGGTASPQLLRAGFIAGSSDTVTYGVRD
ncbi:hypothetical protein [Pseudogemmobacter bohemicus]|uniref:hypothetical protein n=1 Tax=Pseudogemmobacter bohemicus TaxID=2250708 RepID=UPI000DD33C0F|nr:hypothetical protein [Pseudogemmobacter bohemicus]